MATKKAKKSAAKKTASAKPKAASKAVHATSTQTQVDYDPSSARRVLGPIQARVGLVADDDRELFDAQASDAERAERGGRTKSSNVLSEAVRWAVQVDADGAKYPALFASYYDQTRFGYLVDRTLALAAATDTQRGSRAGKTAVVTSSTDAEGDARAARRRLLRKMKSFAGLRAKERGDLEVAKTMTAVDGDPGASIGKLVVLAETWLARTDAASKRLADKAKLTNADLQKALTAAEARSSASAGTIAAGKGTGHDTIEVNLAEGAVLLEMLEAMACVNEANEDHPSIRRLSPSARVKRGLGIEEKKPNVAPPNDGGTPGTGSGGGDTTTTARTK